MLPSCVCFCIVSPGQLQLQKILYAEMQQVSNFENHAKWGRKEVSPSQFWSFKFKHCLNMTIWNWMQQVNVFAMKYLIIFSYKWKLAKLLEQFSNRGKDREVSNYIIKILPILNSRLCKFFDKGGANFIEEKPLDEAHDIPYLNFSSKSRKIIRM